VKGGKNYRVTLWPHIYPIISFLDAASKGKDGRKAYQALKEHYLGANNTNLLAAKYEKEIGDFSYTGDKCRWRLEKYIKKHVEYYNILNHLKAHGYAGMDTASSVRKLLNGIKCKDLESPISIILAKPDTTFDEATRILKDFLSAYSSARSSKITQIGAVGGNQSGGGRGSIRIKPREERMDAVMVMPTTATQVRLKTVNILQLNTRP
jgi:hypothetical protein